jgi:hypothetical protein
MYGLVWKTFKIFETTKNLYIFLSQIPVHARKIVGAGAKTFDKLEPEMSKNWPVLPHLIIFFILVISLSSLVFFGPTDPKQIFSLEFLLQKFAKY